MNGEIRRGLGRNNGFSQVILTSRDLRSADTRQLCGYMCSRYCCWAKFAFNLLQECPQTQKHTRTLLRLQTCPSFCMVSAHTHKHTMLLAFPTCIQYVLSRPSRPTIHHANIYKLQAYANGCIPQRFRSLIESQVMRRAVAGWQSSKLCPAQKMVTEHVSQVTRTCLRCELMDGRLKMYEFHGESWWPDRPFRFGT
jgi:hypothetical protein